MSFVVQMHNIGQTRLLSRGSAYRTLATLNSLAEDQYEHRVHYATARSYSDSESLGRSLDATRRSQLAERKRRPHCSSQQLAQLGKMCLPILVEAQHAGELPITAKQKHRRRMFDRIFLSTAEAPESRTIGVGEPHDGID